MVDLPTVVLLSAAQATRRSVRVSSTEADIHPGETQVPFRADTVAKVFLRHR
jgi:hypothetical protein